MKMKMATGIHRLEEQIGNLYLNQTDSDVTIIVDGKKFPAHRLILKRCPFFENMFASNLEESKTGQIRIQETSAAAFQIVLEWIYTDDLNLADFNSNIEVLRLAHMYDLPEVVEDVVYHLETQCTIDNVVPLLNVAVFYSLDDLKEHVIKVWKRDPNTIFQNDAFLYLTPDALKIVLKYAMKTVSQFGLLLLFVQWMKANTYKKQHFQELLKIIPLDSMLASELAQTIPSDLVDGIDVLNVVREQMALAEACSTDNSCDVLTKYTAKNIPKFEIERAKGHLIVYDDLQVKHKISSHDDNGIVVDLGRRYKLNHLKMRLDEEADEKATYSYWIAVSEDNIYWTRVIDHSKHACRSLQKLYFKERTVRYIRICGTAAADGIFKMYRLDAYHTSEPFEIDPKTTLLMPSENVALVENNAIVIQGKSRHVKHAIISGECEDKYCTYQYINKGSIIVQLPQPYLLDRMEFRLSCVASYHIEVSIDQYHWTRVFDEEKVTSWRKIQFEKQPVVFIKITGTYSVCSYIICSQLDCFADQKDKMLEV